MHNYCRYSLEQLEAAGVSILHSGVQSFMSAFGPKHHKALLQAHPQARFAQPVVRPEAKIA